MEIFNNKLSYILITISIFIKLTTISSNGDDLNFGNMCIGNSTTGNYSYHNYDNHVSSLLSELDLKSISSKSSFLNTSVGSARDKAYGYYICWGNITPKLCQKCVKFTTQALLNQDFYRECVGYGYYLDWNLCLVHYGNKSIIEYNDNLASMGIGGDKMSNYAPYNRTLSTNIEQLIKEMETGNRSTTNFATQVAPITGSNDEIHVLVQCIPIISSKNCTRCLRKLYGFVSEHNAGSEREFVHPDCTIKFSNQSFIGGAFGSLIPSYYLLVFWIILVFCVT